MNVLVACEESQIVCKAFRKLGHIAYSCDIQECSGGFPEWHIKADVSSLLNGNCVFVTQDGLVHQIFGRWDIIIAHPPCTYMSKAGACRMYPTKGCIDPDRFSKAMSAKSFFMTIYNADCDHICVENPLPLKCVGLPPPSQIIQPYQFGHPFSKMTLLWLKGLPDLIPTKVCTVWRPYLPSCTSRFAGTDYNKGASSGSKNRSLTFAGIAAAMADQWTSL